MVPRQIMPAAILMLIITSIGPAFGQTTPSARQHSQAASVIGIWSVNAGGYWTLFQFTGVRADGTVEGGYCGINRGGRFDRRFAGGPQNDSATFDPGRVAKGDYALHIRRPDGTIHKFTPAGAMLKAAATGTDGRVREYQAVRAPPGEKCF
jgi:hypothetical protein